MKKIYIAIFLSSFMLQGAFAQTCPPTDEPDMLFQDINSDGIDGDTANAVFVAVTGSDTNPGTMLQPVLTIEKGIQIASAIGKDVYVSYGTYVLTSTLQIISGVNIYGLYNSSLGWARSNAYTTIINGIQTAVLADTFSSDTHFEGFEINAASAISAGESSYAVRINGGTAKTILRFNTLKPGSGANGTMGTNGVAGGTGAQGANGGLGSCDGSAYGLGGQGGYSPCGQTGGNGGNGGPEGNNAGQNGGVGISGTPGGNGGGGGDPGGDGQNGTYGFNGTNGSNGAAASQFGTSSLTGVYLPSSGANGSAGTNGMGGGGAGGGGGQGCTLCNNGSGNGGGGGGGGGCVGTIGTGGISGGGSFGVYINNAVAVVDRNTIVTTYGGNGAKGGNGGVGGNGGIGGSGGNTCSSEIGVGGNGGNGGNGGASGSGAGGAGGPSVGIYIDGTSNVQADTNYITLGSGGNGGLGGTNTALGTAPSGPAGVAADIHGTVNAIPIIVPGICIRDVSMQEPTTGTVNMNVVVMLSSPAQETITVHYATTDVSATSGSDYTATSGTLTFLPDQIMKQIPVPILSDLIAELSETFTMTLSVPVNATITDATATCTITDSDVGIEEQTNNTPITYQLLQNNPNPFNGETEIIFGLPHQKEVSLKIYNLSGQVIATLVNETREAGWHHVKYSSSDLSACIYFYSLVTDEAVLFKKLSVIK